MEVPLGFSLAGHRLDPAHGYIYVDCTVAEKLGRFFLKTDFWLLSFLYSGTKPSLFYKQQDSWAWGTDTLGSLTSQQATGPSHTSKGNFPVFRDGYPTLDTQIMLFFYQTEGNL